jgi:hypothetical protein
MRWRYWVLPIAAALLTGPTWGQQTQLSSCPAGSCTIWGGFEDNIGSGADYDYNDLVFSLSGVGLTLGTIGTTGQLFAKPASMNTGAGTGSPSALPFWNNPSQDGAGGFNVGWCIYGGGACNGGVGLAPGDDYAATAAKGSLNNVDFNEGGSVNGTITLKITANGNDALIAYCDGASFSSCHTLSGLNSPGGTATFTPNGEFVIEAKNTSETFASVIGAAGTPTPADGVSHFAFFAPDPVPEPGSIVLFGTILAFGLGSIARKRRKA